jgi:hypothetical protein
MMDTDSTNFNLKNAVRSQPSGVRSTAKCIQQVERGGGHQLDAPPKGNANFAWRAALRARLCGVHFRIYPRQFAACPPTSQAKATPPRYHGQYGSHTRPFFYSTQIPAGL